MNPTAFVKSRAWLMLTLILIAAGTSHAQDLRANDWRRLGQQAFADGRYSDAEAHFKRAVTEFEAFGNPSFEISMTLGDLAAVLAEGRRRFPGVRPRWPATIRGDRWSGCAGCRPCGAQATRGVPREAKRLSGKDPTRVDVRRGHQALSLKSAS